MAIVDSSGNSQTSYQYDVYGEVTGGSGSLANEFDFAGQQADATGLQYLRATCLGTCDAPRHGDRERSLSSPQPERLRGLPPHAP